MGGTSSPLCWNTVYDPIIAIVATVIGIGVPTYVDDAAALVTGPAQTVLVCILLLAAGHAAGLLAEVHTCAWVEGPPVPREIKAVLAAFSRHFFTLS